MAKVSRSNEFVRDEKGGDWFQEYLRILAGQPSTATEMIKAKETVADVIANYKEQTGLNLLTQSELEESHMTKKASVRKISKRIVNGISPISPMKLKKLKNPDDMLKNYDDSDIIVQMKLD